MKKIINNIAGTVFGVSMIAAFLGMAAADSNTNAAIIMIFSGLGMALICAYIMEVTKDDNTENDI